MRRTVVAGVVLLAALVGLALLLHRFRGDHSLSLAEKHLGTWAYLVVFLLVFGDAIFPVLPSETSLLAASTLAAQGALDLGLVVLVGAAGSVAGDSTLYWIARRGSHRIRRRLEKARSRTRIEAALDVLGKNAPVLLVAGRYLPGVRFVVNASMGFSHYPYRRFLVWSSVGGVLWASYTCLVANAVARLLTGFPLASIAISGALIAAAIGIGLLLLRTFRSRAARSLRQGLQSEP
jgi:membrane protein DedA with SNARE-associated domain